MRTYLIALSLLVALPACGKHDLNPIAVSIKVPVACHDTIPDAPEWAMTLTNPNADIADQAKAALVEINQHQAYEDRLKAQLEACM